jgi:hypothetical protein
MLQKTVPQWIAQDMPIRLVVEKQEYREHARLVREMRWGEQVSIVQLPLSHKGLGYARMYCVEHASKSGLDAFIMCNDDCYVKPNSDAWLLIEEAEKSTTLGIGAMRPLLNLFTGGAISRNHGPILCPGSWGLFVWGLNVNKAIEFGNYDPNLHTYAEDVDLLFEGVKHGIPWQIHCDVEYVSVNKRYDNGGFEAVYRNNMEARLAAERKCMDIMRERWPDYVNRPDKPVRFSWQKILNDYIPDWKKASAIHGGSLDYLKGGVA